MFILGSFIYLLYINYLYNMFGILYWLNLILKRMATSQHTCIKHEYIQFLGEFCWCGIIWKPYFNCIELLYSYIIHSAIFLNIIVPQSANNVLLTK